jgi:hypothetical protein
MGIQDTTGLDLVGDDAADKVRAGGLQCVHEFVQLLSVRGRDGRGGLLALATATGVLLCIGYIKKLTFILTQFICTRAFNK